MATTFDSYMPFDSGPGANVTEAGWQAMMQRNGMPGVLRDALNGMSVFGDSTGMQVKVNTGEVWGLGEWGKIDSGIKTLSIASAASLTAGQSRKDLVIWRIDMSNNRIELDVLTGTGATAPTEPNLTRNTSIFESPLAVVNIASSATTTIAAADVLDVRWYGGPTVPTMPDDFAMFGDKISTCTRANCSPTVVAANNDTTYVTLTQAQRDTTATMIRYYLGVARSGGFRDLRVYTGYSRHRLYDATGNIIPADDSSAGNVHSDALPATLNIKAGQFVAFAYFCTSTTTAPQFAVSNTSLSNLLNPPVKPLDPLGRWSTAFKTNNTAIPILKVHDDNNWTARDRSIWFALA